MPEMGTSGLMSGDGKRGGRISPFSRPSSTLPAASPLMGTVLVRHRVTPAKTVETRLRTPDLVEFRMTQVRTPVGDRCLGRWFPWRSVHRTGSGPPRHGRLALGDEDAASESWPRSRAPNRLR